MKSVRKFILAPYQNGQFWRRATPHFLGTGLALSFLLFAWAPWAEIAQAAPSCPRRHQENKIAGRAALLPHAGAKLP